MVNRGFTLIEVLVTVVVVGTALTVILQGAGLGVRAAGAAERKTTAALLAEDVAARLETGEVSLTEDSAGDFGGAAPGYEYAVSVQTLADPPDLVVATIEISWGMDDSGSAPAGTYALERWIYRPPASSTAGGVTRGPNLGTSDRGSTR